MLLASQTPPRGSETTPPWLGHQPRPSDLRAGRLGGVCGVGGQGPLGAVPQAGAVEGVVARSQCLVVARCQCSLKQPEVKIVSKVR